MRYSEKQQFPDWLRYGILLFNCSIIYFLFKSEALNMQSRLIIFFVLLLPSILYFWTLETELDQNNIYLHIRPFLSRTYTYNDIDSWQIRTYKPILEYGGWGIRYGHKGTAYNIRGNQGLQLHLTSGKRILIGTQKQQELQRVMRSIIPDKEIMVSSVG